MTEWLEREEGGACSRRRLSSTPYPPSQHTAHSLRWPLLCSIVVVRLNRPAKPTDPWRSCGGEYWSRRWPTSSVCNRCDEASVAINTPKPFSTHWETLFCLPLVLRDVLEVESNNATPPPRTPGQRFSQPQSEPNSQTPSDSRATDAHSHAPPPIPHPPDRAFFCFWVDAIRFLIRDPADAGARVGE